MTVGRFITETLIAHRGPRKKKKSLVCPLLLLQDLITSSISAAALGTRTSKTQGSTRSKKKKKMKRPEKL